MSGTSRPRRSDAVRRTTEVVDAAVALLGDGRQASIGEIAAAAGVSRQTVYAHFGSRDALLAAAVDRVAAQAIEAFDAASGDDASPAEALDRLLELSWRMFVRHQRLLDAAQPRDSDDEERRHLPIAERLERILERGQADGSFDLVCDERWIVDSIIALGHAAGARVHQGSLSVEAASAALRASTFRLLGVRTRERTSRVSRRRR